MMKTLNRSLASLLCMCVAVACSHTLPPYTAKPIPSPHHTPSVPAVTQVPASQLPEAMLPVTLVLDLTSVERTLQTIMPERFSEAQHPLGSDYRWNFVREKDPQVAVQDGWVTIHATYKGDIEAKTAARGCRLDPVYPVLDTTGQLELRPEGDALILSLKSPQTTIGLKPESESKCNMFNSPVKDQLAELLNRGVIDQSIKRAVDEGRFQIPLQQIWTRLQSPIAVNVPTSNTQACIYGKPAEIAVGPMKGTAQRTTIPIVVKETPTAIFATSCTKASDSAMKVTSAPALLTGQSYKVSSSVPVPYSVINEALQEKLFHQPMKVGAEEMVIEQATASDSSGNVLITTDIAGDLNGPIYYWGTPHLDSAGSVLTIPDLQMANESKAMLDNIKLGYWQLVDGSLRPTLQRAARVDLTDRIAKMKAAITGRHTNGDMTMEIMLIQQQPQRAYSTPGAVVADILFQGTASGIAPLALEPRPTAEQTPSPTPGVLHPPNKM